MKSCCIMRGMAREVFMDEFLLASFWNAWFVFLYCQTYKSYQDSWREAYDATIASPTAFNRIDSAPCTCNYGIMEINNALRLRLLRSFRERLDRLVKSSGIYLHNLPTGFINSCTSRASDSLLGRNVSSSLVLFYFIFPLSGSSLAIW